MHRSKHKLFAFSVALTGLAAIITNAQNAPSVPHWSPDKTLAKRLGAVVKVEEYSLQPPKNYQMQKGNAPEGMKAFAWVGEARQDGTHPTLVLGLIVPPAGEAKSYTLEQLVDKLLVGVKRHRTDWQQGKTEKGLVNDMTFARISWTGTEPTQKRNMQGFIYVAFDGDTIIQLTSQDVLPQAKQALSIAEASVLTFKKRQ